MQCYHSTLDQWYWYWNKWCLIQSHVFLSCHLNGDLRRIWQGSADSGLCQRVRANGEDNCSHGGVWQRPGDTWTGVWHRDPEFEGLWGEKNNSPLLRNASLLYYTLLNILQHVLYLLSTFATINRCFLKYWMSLLLYKPQLSFRHVDISPKWKLGLGVLCLWRLTIISTSSRHAISHCTFFFSRPWVKPTTRNQWWAQAMHFIWPDHNALSSDETENQLFNLKHLFVICKVF